MSFADVTVHARRALLDAIEALQEHRQALVLVGAQAVYVYTGDADVAIATRTNDADLAVVPADLHAKPRLEHAMERAGFRHEPEAHQPGQWISCGGYPVELLVPETLQRGEKTRRGARIPPHSTRAARIVLGLEAAAVDNSWQEIRSLDQTDPRVISIRVASPAALVSSVRDSRTTTCRAEEVGADPKPSALHGSCIFALISPQRQPIPRRGASVEADHDSRRSLHRSAP